MKRQSLAIGFALVLATGIASNVNAATTEVITDKPGILPIAKPIQNANPILSIQDHIDVQYDYLYQLYLEESEARKVLEAQIQAIAETCSKPRDPKKYYLTETYHQGDTVRYACAEGYHLANITEMRHADELVPLVSEDFNGSGWIDMPVHSPKVRLCVDWSSENEEDYGMKLNLYDPAYDFITEGVNEIGTSKDMIKCNTELPVWCIED